VCPSRWVALAVLLALSLPGTAAADACHAGPPLETLGLGLHLSAALEFATYDNARGEGHYAGVALGAGYIHDWLRLRAQLPAYRLKRNGETFTGPGDVLFAAEVAIFRDADRFGSGLGLAVSAPTGNADEDLGMGHFMLMPGAWAEFTRGPAFVQAQVAYGRALGADHAPAGEHAGHPGHAQHATGPGPIVNPMNASEITGRLSAGYRVFGIVRPRAGFDAAIPIADDQGEARAIAVLGVDFLPDPFDFALEGQLPFVGDPFTAKAELIAGFRF